MKEFKVQACLLRITLINMNSTNRKELKRIQRMGFPLVYTTNTRKSSCVNARGIPPARGRKMLTPPPAGPDPPPPHQLDLTPPGWLDLTPPPASWTWLPPPTSWTWPPPPPAGPDPPLPAGPDPPPPAGPDPPPHQLDLTPPTRSAGPAPPPSWTWPPPPPAGPDPPPPPAGPDPPRCGLTNKVKLLPSRRTTYAGGNKSFESVSIRPLVIVLHSVLIGSRWVMSSPNEVGASRFLYEMF